VRLNPRPPVPAVHLTGVRVAGEALALPERGVARLGLFDLLSRNNLTIEYGAADLRGGSEIRYQYRLDGVDRDWEPPTDHRIVTYARLQPGTYTFLVRSVDSNGITSVGPARLEFRVLPPVYMRGWFMACAIAALGLAFYALYRYRVARLIEIERVRTRIATDLHDDVGASLSLIAMLSELASRQTARGDAKAVESLASIAGTARELIDTTSDIVWAVDPRKDRVGDLITRMRRFASDAFGARDVTLRFEAQPQDRAAPLAAYIRREVYVVFKELVNNVARHSASTEVQITVAIQAGTLTLRVRDNGRGFDLSRQGEGNGLDSIRARAQRLRAQFRVVSSPGGGCETTLTVPLARKAPSRGDSWAPVS